MWERTRARDRRPGAYGFWDDFEKAIDAARHSLRTGASTTYQLFASDSWFGFGHYSYNSDPGLRSSVRGVGFGSVFGISTLDLERAIGGPFGHPVVSAAENLLQEIVDQIKKAGSWELLQQIARPILGPYSLAAGVLMGLGESLGKDVSNLLGLAKLVVLAGLYERIKHPRLLSFADPLTLALSLAMYRFPMLKREAENADELLWKTLDELKEIAKHPIQFIEIVGQNAWKGVQKDWNDLKYYAANPTISNDFQAGRIMGRALYQIIMMILLVMSVAGVAVKLAARFPWLMRLARIISRGGKLEELEELEQGARAAREAESLPKERSDVGKPSEQKPPEQKGPAKAPKRPSYVHGQSDGGPGVWGKPSTPRNPLGQEYQQLVTGAPPGTEYKVPSAVRSSGYVDFDGYDPGRNVLLDAKDWNDWPPSSPPFLRKNAIQDLVNDAKAQIKAANGTPIEWHVPTEEKAAELREILSDQDVDQIEVVVTTKP